VWLAIWRILGNHKLCGNGVLNLKPQSYLQLMKMNNVSLSAKAYVGWRNVANMASMAAMALFSLNEKRNIESVASMAS
jgi:hypothetical protein